MRTLSIVASSAVLLIACGAFVALTAGSSSVSLCSQPDGPGTACTATQALTKDSANHTMIAVRKGLFGSGSTAVVRIYNDRGEQSGSCMLDLGAESGEQDFGLADCWGNDLHTRLLFAAVNPFGSDTYRMTVEYGSLLAGTSGSIGITTFTIK